MPTHILILPRCGFRFMSNCPTLPLPTMRIMTSEMKNCHDKQKPIRSTFLRWIFNTLFRDTLLSHVQRTLPNFGHRFLLAFARVHCGWYRCNQCQGSSRQLRFAFCRFMPLHSSSDQGLDLCPFVSLSPLIVVMVIQLMRLWQAKIGGFRVLKTEANFIAVI